MILMAVRVGVGVEVGAETGHQGEESMIVNLGRASCSQSEDASQNEQKSQTGR